MIILTEMERFFAKVNRRDDGCWEWTGAINVHGYGVFTHKQKWASAYRFAYQTFVKPVPKGMVLDHLCRNRACVNPEHLEAVAQRENALRGIGPSAVNATKTHCLRGHPFDEANTCISSGRRHCRTCHREREFAKRTRRVLPDTCPLGHPFDDANTYRNRKGHRACKTCINNRKRARYHRLMAEKLSDKAQV